MSSNIAYSQGVQCQVFKHASYASDGFYKRIYLMDNWWTMWFYRTWAKGSYVITGCPTSGGLSFVNFSHIWLLIRNRCRISYRCNFWNTALKMSTHENWQAVFARTTRQKCDETLLLQIRSFLMYFCMLVSVGISFLSHRATLLVS